MQKLLAVSDGTATTANLVARAALAQFETEVEVEKAAGVRSEKELTDLIEKAKSEHAIVVHTLVSPTLRSHMNQLSTAESVTAIDLMGPLLSRLEGALASPASAEPGVFKPFAEEYLERIAAMEFAVRHDDGNRSEEADSADVILLGLSRTAKTPISIHLAYQGWKVANIPLVFGLKPPKLLEKLEDAKVVCLSIQPEALLALRKSGGRRPGTSPLFYADPDNISREIAFADSIYAGGADWPIIDVSQKSVEQVANEIISYLRKHA
jgi:hypothetical protein